MFKAPTIEFSYKNDDLGDPLINDYHALALEPGNAGAEIDEIKAMAFKVNEVMKEYFDHLNVTLVDFKLEFGKTPDGKIILADEISRRTPAACGTRLRAKSWIRTASAVIWAASRRPTRRSCAA